MDATDGSSIATGTTRPDPNDPNRMSEEYVSRLESELAALKASVQTMGSPGKSAASSAPPRATETGEHKSKSSLPAGPDKSGPARNAPPFGKATAVSKTTLDEDLAKAQAKYSDDRLAKFEKAMEEKFAASGGYDSDLEREMAAAEGMPNAHELAVGKVDAGKRAKLIASEKAETDAVNAPFEKQNEWMDEYRRAEDQKAETKNAPISGAANLAARTATLVPADEDGKGDKGSGKIAVATDVSADEAASRNASKASTEATVAELDAARAAVAATRASAPATPIARARAPVAHKPAASFLGGGAHGDGLPRPDVLVRKTKRAATVPNPPSFLSRDASRAKTIAEQRLEHDLAVEAALEEAELKKRFVPKPVPKSTAEPRFTKMLETERLRRERLRETRKQALVETERPFSFYVRDKAKASEKGDPASAEALKARRANKFQRKFVAKAIPKAVKELRLPSMEAEAARRKEEARIAAEIALKEAAMPERMAKNVAEEHGIGAERIGRPTQKVEFPAGAAQTRARFRRASRGFFPAPEGGEAAKAEHRRARVPFTREELAAAKSGASQDRKGHEGGPERFTRSALAFRVVARAGEVDAAAVVRQERATGLFEEERKPRHQAPEAGRAPREGLGALRHEGGTRGYGDRGARGGEQAARPGVGALANKRRTGRQV
jgi:protein FAM161A